ncbi:uncharacterized protein K452DRAFT_203713, partial [Aplosporella prunicola CBS 121167]
QSENNAESQESDQEMQSGDKSADSEGRAEDKESSQEELRDDSDSQQEELADLSNWAGFRQHRLNTQRRRVEQQGEGARTPPSGHESSSDNASSSESPAHQNQEHTIGNSDDPIDISSREPTESPLVSSDSEDESHPSTTQQGQQVIVNTGAQEQDNNNTGAQDDATTTSSGAPGEPTENPTIFHRKREDNSEPRTKRTKTNTFPSSKRVQIPGPGRTMPPG